MMTILRFREKFGPLLAPNRNTIVLKMPHLSFDGGEKGADSPFSNVVQRSFSLPGFAGFLAGHCAFDRSNTTPSRHPLLRLGVVETDETDTTKPPSVVKKNTRNETADDHHDHRIQVMAFWDSNSAGGVRFGLFIIIIEMVFCVVSFCWVASCP